MPRLQSIVLLSALLSCTALGAGLDPVRVGRYSAIVPGPSPEQADPFALRVDTEFRARVRTVGRAIEEVLAPSGYWFADLDASCPSLPALLGLPLPAVHRRLGPMRLDEALKTLAGTAHYLVVDPVHRLVSFELRAPYGALVQKGGPVSGAARDAPTAVDPGHETRSLARAPLATPVRGQPETPIPLSAHAPVVHRIGPIARGAQLWSIAAHLRKSWRATTEQVMVSLFKANPGSFCHQNLHCLKGGAYLDVPQATQVAATTPSDAHRTVQRHLDTWHQRSRRDAHVADATPREVVP